MTIEPNEDLLPRGIMSDMSVFDIRLLNAYNILKDRYPDIWVNCRNGKRLNNWCGYRTAGCPIGAKHSAHKLGKAIDIHAPTQTRLKEIRGWLLNDNPCRITRIEAEEATPNWIHIDFMELNNTQLLRSGGGIYVFKP